MLYAWWAWCARWRRTASEAQPERAEQLLPAQVRQRCEVLSALQLGRVGRGHARGCHGDHLAAVLQAHAQLLTGHRAAARSTDDGASHPGVAVGTWQQHLGAVRPERSRCSLVRALHCSVPQYRGHVCGALPGHRHSEAPVRLAARRR